MFINLKMLFLINILVCVSSELNHVLLGYMHLKINPQRKSSTKF